MADAWSTENGNSSQVYASPSGMVGAINARGAWGIWMPLQGVEYVSMYGDGHQHSVANTGDGNYLYSRDNEAPQLYRYADKWVTGQYFDAAGNVVESFESASASGEPGSIYMRTGRLTANVAPVVPAVLPPVVDSSGGASETWTRDSDGGVMTWASKSGLIGEQNSAGIWIMSIPPIGKTYQSSYGGHTIAIRRINEKQYQLITDGGAPVTYDYRDKWKPGKFYDASGRQFSHASEIARRGDPENVFQITGEVPRAPDQGGFESSAWTRGSDGSANVWASLSGMVGIMISPDVWVMGMPRTRILYESAYQNREVAIINLNNSEYVARRNKDTYGWYRYDAKFKSGMLYDYKGREYSDESNIQTRGDPVSSVFQAVGPAMTRDMNVARHKWEEAFASLRTGGAGSAGGGGGSGSAGAGTGGGGGGGGGGVVTIDPGNGGVVNVAPGGIPSIDDSAGAPSTGKSALPLIAAIAAAVFLK